MSTITPQAIVAEITDLVAFSATAGRVMELAEDPDSAVRDLARALSADPGLAARVLRLANTAYYSTGGSVDSVDRAVNVLGRRRVRDLVVGAATVAAFEGIPIEVITMEDFWSHSLYCGAVAAELAALSPSRRVDSALTAGLLHDVGQLVLFLRAPELARQALMRVAESGDEITMAEAELGLLGFTHMEVGEALSRAWRFPPSLTQAIAHHHRPSEATSSGELVAIVHIANSLAVLAETGSTDLADAPAIDSAAWVTAGIAPADATGCIERAAEQVRALADSLLSKA